MPIEIRELVIRAVVDPPATPRAAQRGSRGDHSKLVQECVDEVLKALRRRSER